MALLIPENEEFLNSIRNQIVAIVEDYGAELVDIELVGRRNQSTLRIFLHKQPSIGLNLCEKVSRDIADYLDIMDPLAGKYRLEVTSPGLDRPLTTDSDFLRAKDRILKIVDHNGKILKGRLVEFNESVLYLKNPKNKEDAKQVKRHEIANATIEVEFKKRG